MCWVLSPRGRRVEIHGNCLSHLNKEKKEINVEIKEENVKIEMMRGKFPLWPIPIFPAGIESGGDRREGTSGAIKGGKK